MFLLLITYLRPLEEIERLIPAHMAWLDRYYENGTFLLSGRKVPRSGGVLLARASSRAAVETLVAEDSFSQAGAAHYDIIEFAPTRAAVGFNNLLD